MRRLAHLAAKGFIRSGLLAASLLAQEPIELPKPRFDQPPILGPGRRPRFEEAMKAQDYPRAEKLLVEAISENPKSVELLKLAAGVFFLDRQYLNAAIAYKKAEKIQPLDDPSRFTLAMAYIAVGKRDWARPELDRLAAGDPRNHLYPYWLARLDYDDQKFAAAVEELNRAVALKPDFLRAHDNLGLNLEALARYDEAQRSYETALRLNRLEKPGSPWPPLNLGVMLLKLGKLSEAETCFRESLQYDPRFAEPHYRLGMLLEKQGKTGEAIQEFAQAASLDVTYPEPQYALARIYRQAGDAEKSRAALAEFQKRKNRKKR